MIDITRGDILRAEADALVNTVNCVGVMGRGIALQFRKAFPGNYKAYESACKRGEVQPGRMFVYRTGRLEGPKYIINFPTKRHWRGPSRMVDIENGLKALVHVIETLGIESIAIPPLGAGLGGLSWSEVEPRIIKALQKVPDVHALVYEPAGAPTTDAMVRESKAPRMTAGSAALVGLMHRYMSGLMDPHVTLLEVHKLMYFLQEAGQPMRLKYVQGHYGPYAENLRHSLIRIEGHLVSGYRDGSDSPGKELSIVPGALEDAQRYLNDHPETLANFDKVDDLVDGFETSFGLELLATVHWVVVHGTARTIEDALEATYAWNDRKKMFTPDQINLAWNVLQSKGWLTLQRPA